MQLLHAFIWMIIISVEIYNVHILVCFMLLCRNLIFLSCCQCGITSKDLKHLLSLFSSSEHKQSLAIHRWWLNDNELNDKGILDLIEYLPLFQHSPEIDISGNPVSSDMQESLQGALVSLKVIILCYSTSEDSYYYDN